MCGTNAAEQWRHTVLERAKRGLPDCWQCQYHSWFVKSYLRSVMEDSNLPGNMKEGRFRERCLSRSMDKLYTKEVFRKAAKHEEMVMTVAFAVGIIGIGAAVMHLRG